MTTENKDVIEVVQEPQVVENDPIVPPHELTQYSETELHAMEQGWKPKDQWEGSPEDWRPAKDYIERGEMIGKIRSLQQQNRQFEQAVRHITEQNTRVFANGYEKAIQDMKQERREALAEQDFVKADELSEKIEEVKELRTRAIHEAARPIQQAQGPDPEHLEWLAKNTWYENPVMQKFADALGIEYVRVNNGQVSPEQVRNYVAATVRKEFAHKFPKPIVAAPNPDASGSRANSNGKPQTTGLNTRLSKIKAEMPEEHRQIMKTIIRASGLTEAEYLEQYAS